jgi:hypothetical protein
MIKVMVGGWIDASLMIAKKGKKLRKEGGRRRGRSSS